MKKILILALICFSCDAKENNQDFIKYNKLINPQCVEYNLTEYNLTDSISYINLVCTAEKDKYIIKYKCDHGELACSVINIYLKPEEKKEAEEEK